MLILDEPAAGLDPRARVELRELIHLLATELNKTVLISSHILTELGEICDSAVIIEAGEILDLPLNLVGNFRLETLETAGFSYHPYPLIFLRRQDRKSSQCIEDESVQVGD